MRLEIHDPGVLSARDVYARARATVWRRRVGYASGRAALPQRAVTMPSAPILKLPTWTEIRDQVARQAGVEPHLLTKAGGRKLQIVSLRQLAISLTRRLTDLSFPAIGRRYGLDHSTIVNSVARMRPLMAALERDLTDAAPVRAWVGRGLLLLPAHVSAMRRQPKPTTPRPLYPIGNFECPICDEGEAVVRLIH
jgi:Bacterial dnaA protein helix-turn-helix